MTTSPVRASGLRRAFLFALLFAAVYVMPQRQAQAQEQEAMTPQQPGYGIDLLSSVRQALEHNASIRVSTSQIGIAQGQVQVASGQFDTIISANIQKQRVYTPSTADEIAAGAAPPVTSTNAFNSTLQASRQLRNGITLTPALTLGRTADALSAPGTVPPNRSTVGLTVTVPLLRNAGRDVVGAAETAAQQELQAVQFDQSQNVAQITVNVVSAYWQYLAAEDLRLIALEAESSSTHRTQDTSRLVHDEMIPAADRDLAIADEAAKRQARMAAEQALVEARSNLARLLGMSATQARALPLPNELFPNADGGDLSARLPLIRNLALERRADLAAAQIRYDEAQVILTALRKNLRPQLDFVLGVSSNGVNQGASNASYFSAAGSNMRGPNIVVALNYQIPVGNDVANGQLLQKMGAVDQLDISRHDLSDTILTSVDTLASSVQRLALQLADATRAVQLYAKSVDNEEIRRRMGLSTLIDVLNISDRLLQARQTLITVQLNYASAIAQLRFASGTLFQANGGDLSLEHAYLTTVP